MKLRIQQRLRVRLFCTKLYTVNRLGLKFYSRIGIELVFVWWYPQSSDQAWKMCGKWLTAFKSGVQLLLQLSPLLVKFFKMNNALVLSRRFKLVERQAYNTQNTSVACHKVRCSKLETNVINTAQ